LQKKNSFNEKNMKFLIAISSAAILLFITQPARGSTAAPSVSRLLPLQIPNGQYRPLDETGDSGLQSALERALEQNDSWRSLIEKKKMAVGVVDLSNPEEARFAGVNGRTMMYAASLPKIAILLAAFQCFEDDTLKETPQIHDDLIAMIRRSDNAAASRTIDRIGLRRIEAVLQDRRYQFYDPEKGGGIWVGGRYGQGGERNPESLHGLTHAATVSQVCRFYYMLAYGEIINPQRSRQMLDILSKPGLHDKFVSVMEKHVPPDRMFRKSGEWNVYHSDSILVWDGGGRQYILTALVESEKGEQILKELVPIVEQLLNFPHHEARARAVD
jgi:beta-lactamase class A